MTDKTVDLDRHRGIAAQKATKLGRLLADVEANEKALRVRQEELESHLLAAPAKNWHEAAEKARYLLNLFAATLTAEDPRTEAHCPARRRGVEISSAIHEIAHVRSGHDRERWHLRPMIDYLVD